MIENGRILVPLDGSALSERALPHAAELARKFAARLVLARCLALSSLQLPPEVLAPAREEELEAVEREHIARYLAAVRQGDDWRELVADVRILVGLPADEILELAESERVDVIVMSSHGRSGLGRFIYGSVAEKILHHAPCPLMLIRAGSQGVNF